MSKPRKKAESETVTETAIEIAVVTPETVAWSFVPTVRPIAWAVEVVPGARDLAPYQRAVIAAAELAGYTAGEVSLGESYTGGRRRVVGSV